MGTGYTRNDTADNIADGNIINASDLDGEFDALQSAFDNSTGHTHDGTAGEGAPIEKVGPNQEVVVTSNVLRPAANNTIDLGVQTTNEFKDLWLDGTAYLDSVDIDGGTIDGLSVLTVDNLSLNGNTITSTDTNGNLNLRANGDGIISVDATDVNFGDGDKATFGDGSDLQIYHDTSSTYGEIASVIADTGSGPLKIAGGLAGRIELVNSAGDLMLKAVGQGEVNLYHNNAAKLATTSTGIDVTGDVQASDDLILASDSSKITFGADGDIQITHNADAGLILENTNTGDSQDFVLTLQSNEDTITADEQIARINFSTNSTAGGQAAGTQASIKVDATDTYSATVAGSRMEFHTTTGSGTNTRAMYIDDDQSVVFTGPSANVKLDATNSTLDFPDNFKIMMGAGDDLQIYHDGSNSYVDATGTGHLFLQAQVADKDVRILSDDGSGGLAEYIIADGSLGSVKLKYYGDNRLTTTSTGVDITGGFTATDGSTITVDDNSVALELICTDTDASQGPILRLSRDVTGAASDVIGTIHYYGEDVGGNGTQYAEIEGRIGDATDGAEDGELVLSTMISGTSRARLNFNSTESVFNEGSQDLDFRVESNGNANMLFVDGGNNRVGVGTNAPDYPLVVQAANSRLQLLNTGTNTGISGILFGDADTATRGQINYNHSSDSLDIVVNATERMRITSSGNVGIGTSSPTGLLELSAGTGSGTLSIVSTVNAVDAGNKIAFFGASRSDADEEMAYIKPLLVTNNGGSGNVQEGQLTFGTSGSEAMRIDDSGNLLVGKSSSNISNIGLEADSNGHTKITRSSGTANVNTVLQLNRLTTDGDILTLKKDGVEVGSAGTTSSDLYIGTGNTTLRFADGVNGVIPTGTNGAQRDGAVNLGAASNRFSNLYLSGGVYLGGTGSANRLDDYEYGTWTPAMSAYAGSVTSYGEYFKVGDMVTASFAITLDGTADGSAWRIANLPFNWDSTVGGSWGGCITKQDAGLDSNSFQVVTTNDVLLYNANGNTRTYNVVGVSSEIRGMVTYKTT